MRMTGVMGRGVLRAEHRAQSCACLKSISPLVPAVLGGRSCCHSRHVRDRAIESACSRLHSGEVAELGQESPKT